MPSDFHRLSQLLDIQSATSSYRMFFSDTATGVGTPVALAHFNETTTSTVSPINLTNSVDNASVLAGIFQGDRATPGDGDSAYISLRLSDSAGNQDEQARISWSATTVADGATQDGDLFFSVLANNVLTEMLRLDGSAGIIDIVGKTIYGNGSANGAITPVGTSGWSFTYAGGVRLYFSTRGNMNLSSGTTDEGANAGVGTFQIANATAPSASVADKTIIYANDFAGGDSRLYFLAELGSSIAIGNDSLLFSADGTITRAALAGVAGSLTYDLPIAAGGAANAVVQQRFMLDSVIESGLLGETDGAGTYTQAKTIWKVPYRDSGAAVAAPTAPTTAATWNGGLRVEGGDDANRIYVFVNEAWHYATLT